MELTSATEGTLSAAIETNPQLKTPLKDVSVTLPMGDAVQTCQPDQSGSWDAAGHKLLWRLPQPLSRDKPATCSACVGGEEGFSTAATEKACQVSFGCDGVTISGIELEVQMGSAAQPVAKLNRRFVAGEYTVAFDSGDQPPPAADAE